VPDRGQSAALILANRGGATAAQGASYSARPSLLGAALELGVTGEAACRRTARAPCRCGPAHLRVRGLPRTHDVHESETPRRSAVFDTLMLVNPINRDRFPPHTTEYRRAYFARSVTAISAPNQSHHTAGFILRFPTRSNVGWAYHARPVSGRSTWPSKGKERPIADMHPGARGQGSPSSPVASHLAASGPSFSRASAS
jgi:hypothetical protein